MRKYEIFAFYLSRYGTQIRMFLRKYIIHVQALQVLVQVLVYLQVCMSALQIAV